MHQFLAPFLFCPTIVGQKQKVLTPKTLANIGNNWEFVLYNNNPPAPFLFCPTIVGQKQKVLTPKTLANIGNNWEFVLYNNNPPNNCRIIAKLFNK